jgi:uncharacterized protein YuzE
MSLTIGSHTFDRVNYDEGGDVLYLHKGDAISDSDWDETPEGHGISFNTDGELVGLTIVSPRHLLERHGEIKLTLPVREEHISLHAAEVDPALAAA